MTDKSFPQPESQASASDKAVSQLGHELVSGAHHLGGDMKHIASDVAGEAKKTAESKLGAGKDFAAEHLGSVAHALRKTSEELRSSESAVTEYVDKAASSVEKVSGYLQTRTLSQLMGDVEGFARREPAIFLGGAFFLGMMGGRFLKSATPAKAPSPQGNGIGRQEEGFGAQAARASSQAARTSGAPSFDPHEGKRQNDQGRGQAQQGSQSGHEKQGTRKEGEASDAGGFGTSKNTPAGQTPKNGGPDGGGAASPKVTKTPGAV